MRLQALIILLFPVLALAQTQVNTNQIRDQAVTLPKMGTTGSTEGQSITSAGSGGEANVDVRVRNNIIYDQSTCDCGAGGANVLVRGEGSGNTWTSCVFQNNIVNGMSTTLPSGWTTSNTLTGAPGLTGSGVNPTPFISDPFYRPSAGSIAIGSGLDIGYGASPNRGRY